MVRVLVTGAAGFLGRRLTQALLSSGSLVCSDGVRRPVGELVLVDLAPVEPPPASGTAVEVRQGDLGEADFVASLLARGFDSLFHLASYLTLQAEEDPARAFAVNVEALRRLIDGARGSPKVVFTSSIAVFGGCLPEAVGDEVAPSPATTYGSHKLIDEILIADYTRHGRIDGRSLRLPIVLTRPGAPQAAVSDRVAGILREPLNGRDVVAPFDPATLLPIASAGAVVASLVKLHDLPQAELPQTRAFNLPALSVTVSEMAAAVARSGAAGRVGYAPDPRMQAIVEGWPSRFVSQRAARLGVGADADIDAVIHDYLENREP